MALASLTDLVALGALPVNDPSTSALSIRGTRLLALASAQVAGYLGAPESTILSTEWTDTERTIIAAVVAEVASSRINVSAAASTDPYGDQYGYSSVLLNRRHYQTLDQVLRDRSPRSGLFTIGVTRGDLETGYPELIIPSSSAPEFNP